jgi:hypothetical protein
MRIAPIVILAMVELAIAGITIGAGAQAQADVRRLGVKSGENIELGPVYFVANCRSIMIGLPEIEILEGPPQVTLSIKEAQVLPRRQGCAAPVAGGKLMLSAKSVTERTEAKLTFRLKYKTKDGDRQISNSYIVSLFP